MEAASVRLGEVWEMWIPRISVGALLTNGTVRVNSETMVWLSPPSCTERSISEWNFKKRKETQINYLDVYLEQKIDYI